MKRVFGEIRMLAEQDCVIWRGDKNNVRKSPTVQFYALTVSHNRALC